MILCNVSLFGSEGLRQIRLAEGKIKTISAAGTELAVTGEMRIDLDGALVLPGLINSHDHLDFNLFPRLGNRVYTNYTEWGPDIQATNSHLISRIKKIPAALRVQWGLYKNLLNGFTSVVHHGERVKTGKAIIHVFQENHVLHSPSFEKNWKARLLNPFSTRLPYVLHIGEGTDKAASREIDRVIRWNILRKKLVAVHGVAMNERQAPFFRGLVFCPASNYFMLGRTAPIEKLAGKTTLVFGTDSTLTASWNAWDHFREALQYGLLTEQQLLDMLTEAPARLWKLEGRGRLSEGAAADLLVLEKTNPIFSSGPPGILLLLVNGEIRLADERVAGQVDMKDASRIVLEDRVKKISGNLPALCREIREYYPEAVFPFSYE